MEESPSLEPTKPVQRDYPKFKSWSDRKAAWAAIDPDKPLTRRERVFIAEYAKDMNASAALQRTSWGGKRPDMLASRIMKRANVAKAVENVVAERAKASEVSIERIVERYSKYAFSEGTGPVLHSHVLQALEMLAKWKRMTAPESVVTVPVIFQFIGGPELVQDGKTIESASTLALATDSRDKPR